VCLIPARTATAAFHAHCMQAADIRLVRGRLTFVGAPAGAPFPSAIVVFRSGLWVPTFMSCDRLGQEAQQHLPLEAA